MSPSLRRPKEAINVLIVTPDNLTGEVLKNAVAHARKEFAVETLTGSSQKVIGELGAHKPHVALICEGFRTALKPVSRFCRSYGNLTTTPLLSCCHAPSPIAIFVAIAWSAPFVKARGVSSTALIP
jgi:hypothetical protein